jgi:hypothetical protein
MYALMWLLPVVLVVAGGGGVYAAAGGRAGRVGALAAVAARCGSAGVRRARRSCWRSCAGRGSAAGLEIEGVAWWISSIRKGWTSRAPGRERPPAPRQCYSARAWRELDRSEQVFLAARQMAWQRQHGPDCAVQASAGGDWPPACFSARRGPLPTTAARARGLSGATAPEAFPFWVVALFRAARRWPGWSPMRRCGGWSWRADRFALREAGGRRGAAQSCLRQDFLHEPFAVDAPAWQVWLLRRQPTALRRLAQAESLAAGPSAEV